MRRFVVLVSGTLVYSKGDTKQAEAEAAELEAATASFEAAPVPEVAPVLGGALSSGCWCLHAPPKLRPVSAADSQHQYNSSTLRHGLGCSEEATASLPVLLVPLSGTLYDAVLEQAIFACAQRRPARLGRWVCSARTVQARPLQCAARRTR